PLFVAFPSERNPIEGEPTKNPLHLHADDLTFASGRVFFTGMSALAPNEICKYELRNDMAIHFSEALGAVTPQNEALLKQIDMQPLESFTFNGANDDEVQGFMVKPPGFDPNKKYPLKFLLHGGPQGAWGDEWTYRWNAELFAASGNYVVVIINFHGS